MMHLHQDAQIARKQNRIMQTDTFETLLSRREVARRFGVSLSTVTRWARTGLIRAVRTPGGHYRYPAAELSRALPGAGDVEVNVKSSEKGGPDERHPRTQ